MVPRYSFLLFLAKKYDSSLGWLEMGWVYTTKSTQPLRSVYCKEANSIKSKTCECETTLYGSCFHHLSGKSKTKLILMCMQQLQLSEDFFFHSTVICSHLHLEWRPEQAVQGNNVCCFASLICFMPKVILYKSLGQLFHLF